MTRSMALQSGAREDIELSASPLDVIMTERRVVVRGPQGSLLA
jgi:hypothetical protein